MKYQLLILILTVTLIGAGGLLYSQHSPAQSTSAADLNNDNCVDRDDYDLLMNQIRSGSAYDAIYDLNGDGSVNRADGRTMVASFSNPKGEGCVEVVVPEISWEPESLEVTLMAGESTTTEVTFVASEDVENAEVAVSSELSDNVSVYPTMLDLSKGLSQKVTLSFAASEKILPKITNGILYVKVDSEQVSRPLQIKFTTIWESVSNSLLHEFSFQYPSFGKDVDVVFETRKTGQVYAVIRMASNYHNGEKVGQAVITFIDNPDLLLLTDWINNKIDSTEYLITSGAYTEKTFSNGVVGLVYNGKVPAFVIDEIGPIDQIYAISPSKDTIIIATYLHENEWSDYVSSGEEKSVILESIVGSINF